MLFSAGVGFVATIEPPSGLLECKTIRRMLGLKAVLVGPFDLSVALGHHGNLQHSEPLAGVERLIAAARPAGLPLPMSVFATDPAAFGSRRAHWAAPGVRHFAIGADNAAVTPAFRNRISRAR